MLILTITPTSPNFPLKLQPLKPKIKQLNYMGDVSLIYKPILGVVGPRKASDYGSQVTHALFEEAKQYHLVTVSGMAEGIDQLGHALSIVHQIPTIAVLGGGIGRFSKSKERHIVEKIVESGGLVISEFDNEFEPAKYTFPLRNRIIAGLADVLFVPEAGKKSGSLITVECALDMQKPVFATPGSVFAPTSEGINYLFQEKKINAVADMQTFLSLYFSHVVSTSPRPENRVPRTDLSEQELKIIDILSEKNECSLQELTAKIGLPIGEMIGTLTMLEIQKCIYQSTPGTYTVRK